MTAKKPHRLKRLLWTALAMAPAGIFSSAMVYDWQYGRHNVCEAVYNQANQGYALVQRQLHGDAQEHAVRVLLACSEPSLEGKVRECFKRTAEMYRKEFGIALQPVEYIIVPDPEEGVTPEEFRDRLSAASSREHDFAMFVTARDYAMRLIEGDSPRTELVYQPSNPDKSLSAFTGNARKDSLLVFIDSANYWGQDQLAWVAEHEVGHLFGARHTETPGDIMNKNAERDALGDTEGVWDPMNREIILDNKYRTWWRMR